MKIFGKIILATALSYGLYKGANYLSAQNTLKKAGSDPAVLQAVALHDALTGKGGKLFAMLANTSPAGMLLSSLFSSTSSQQVQAQQILDQVQDLEAVRKHYKALYFANLDAALVKALGTGGAAAVITAEQGKTDNPNNQPHEGNTFVPRAQAVPHPIGPGMKSSIFAVVRRNDVYLYQEPKTEGFVNIKYVDKRIYEKGSTFTPIKLKTGAMAGYATGVSEKDASGTIWLQMGKRTLNPTSTWWVKKTDVDLFPDYSSAKAKYPHINKTLLKANGLDLLEGAPLSRKVVATQSTILIDGRGEYLDAVGAGKALGEYLSEGLHQDDQIPWVVVSAMHTQGVPVVFAVQKAHIKLV